MWRSLALPAHLALLDRSDAHKVGAIYFGQWHPTDINDALHGPGWTEWNLVTHATPRWPGHMQPNMPLDNVTGFGPSHPENDPSNMAAKIDAATKNGIDFFLFDWYWYAHPMLGTDARPGMGTFLEGALEQGFLKAPNSDSMEFALMWANQDWVDLHPAKKSWNRCYRQNPDVKNPSQQPNQSQSGLYIFDGFLNQNVSIAEAALDYVVDTYFTKKNYLRVPTLIESGGSVSVEQCCLFSLYQLEYLYEGLGDDATASLLTRFRDRTAKQSETNPDACKCVHLNSMQDSPTHSASSALMDGFSDYGWMKTTTASTFPETPYEEIMEKGVAKWTQRDQAVAPKLYIPPVSVGWDPSPRTLPTEPYLQDNGYPWSEVWRATPGQWKASLQHLRDFLDQRCSSDYSVGVGNLTGADFCPPMIMNAWNEWSEGAYLEPDERDGFAKMEAVGQVFGQQTEAPKISVGAIRWDAWFGAPEDHNFGVVGRTVAIDLSPDDYHYRLPFFSKELPEPDPNTNATVLIDGNSTEVMAQEIKYAAEFGIDYWAFCAYPIGCKDDHPPDSDCPGIQCCADNVALSYALERYLEQPPEMLQLVSFSLILQPGYWYPAEAHGGSETVQEEAERFASYFAMPNYQKVLGGRPIVYVFGGNDDISDAIQVLRTEAQKVLGPSGNPYIVQMAGSAQGAFNRAQSMGLDGISAYVVQKNPHNDAGVPYTAGIAEPEVEFWNQAKSLGASLVPPIGAGWDPRPRQFIDLPWGDAGKTACVEKLGHTCYIEDPSLEELESHTRDGIAFALQNAATVDSGSVMISAWNENDEGHWIVPSLQDGTAKLEAVKRGIGAAHQAPQRGLPASDDTGIFV